jgi:hypothetical protein
MKAGTCNPSIHRCVLLRHSNLAIGDHALREGGAYVAEGAVRYHPISPKREFRTFKKSANVHSMDLHRPKPEDLGLSAPTIDRAPSENQQELF